MSVITIPNVFVRFTLRLRATWLGLKLSWFATAITRERSSGLTGITPEKTCDTVPTETRAFRATSLMVAIRVLFVAGPPRFDSSSPRGGINQNFDTFLESTNGVHLNRSKGLAGPGFAACVWSEMRQVPTPPASSTKKTLTRTIH